MATLCEPRPTTSTYYKPNIDVTNEMPSLSINTCGGKSFDSKVKVNEQEQSRMRLPLSDTDNVKQSLLTNLTNFSQDNSEDILMNIYYCAEDNVHFNKEEQKTIGENLEKNLKYIINFLYIFGDNFDPTCQPSPLEYRSALQFILDDYKDFPTNENGETLKVVLNDNLQTINRTIKVLDEAIMQWKKLISEEIDRDDYTEDDLVKPEWIKEGHKWWMQG